MIDDFRPAKRPGKSLRAALDGMPEAPKPARAEPAASTDAEPFRTPDEVAAEQTLEPNASEIEPTPIAAEQQFPEPKTGWKRHLEFHWPPGKKEYITAAVLLVLIGGGTAFALTRSSPKPVVSHITVKTPVIAKPTTVPSTLTGLPVAPSVNNQPVTAVMVENSDEARPQSGLSQAGVVFEAVAEGGVTRFMALYQDTAPTNVGPIRSARPYYIEWALGFDAGYAHVGGSPDALADIKTWNVRDLDQFYNGSSYHRISTREAPHNVYTGIPTLNQLEVSKGYTTSTYTGFVRKTASPSKQPTARTINLTLSGADYNAQYSYNASTNSYDRSEGGSPQIDANTSTQLSPKVVIAMITPESRGALDATGAYYSDYNVIGSGTAYVFQDGTVTVGQWTKSSNSSQIVFTTTSGATLGLDPGQTWLTAVTGTNDVSYTP